MWPAARGAWRDVAAFQGAVPVLGRSPTGVAARAPCCNLFK
ncbi:hypothetical protein MBELCI_0920 [Limimaricola cinnabarinus LL-001]|uniref:Uncharacterized protein n=1 Tax=Limimaricola cinnabarinus LL-001 TaxID=1337093 RepID=U3AJB0_9RHOB|nr:hypothetical protein MBELCI_0920 [Limimaricola cinnabarinus LL-001]